MIINIDDDIVIICMMSPISLVTLVSEWYGLIRTRKQPIKTINIDIINTTSTILVSCERLV